MAEYNKPAFNMEHQGDVYPAWYKLRYVSPGAIIFLVRSTVLGWFNEITPNGFGCADEFCKDFPFLEFTAPTELRWGYNQSIITSVSEDADWMQYQLSLPDRLTAIDAYQEMVAVAASIGILLRALNAVRTHHIAPCRVPQLLTFASHVGKDDMCGFPLGAYYSKYIAEWSEEHMQQRNNFEIVEAMQNAYRVLSNDWEKEYHFGFEARQSEPWYFMLEIGMSYGLGPDGSLMKETDISRGYRVDMHNPDTVFHQLCLIAGLCRLYEVVERWYRMNNPKTLFS